MMRSLKLKILGINEANKLRKMLDQQLIGFQDIITKLANKLQRQLLAKQIEHGNLIWKKVYWIVQNYQNNNGPIQLSFF